MATSVTINGTEYASATKAAKAIWDEGKAGKTVAQVTKEINKAAGSDIITYQTVFVNTAGKAKGDLRRVKYRVLNLGKTGRKTVGEIATTVGWSTSKVSSLLKKNAIVALTKEAKAKAEKANADAKAAEKAEKAAQKKAEREARKAAKAAKPAEDAPAENTTETPTEPVVDNVETPEIPADIDASARAQAEADMAADAE